MVILFGRQLRRQRADHFIDRSQTKDVIHLSSVSAAICPLSSDISSYSPSSSPQTGQTDNAHRADQVKLQGDIVRKRHFYLLL